MAPVKNALATLLGHVPSVKAFAGYEGGMADDAQEGAAFADSKSVGKMGLLNRLKSFKKSLREMSDFQKLILLTIAVCLPAGILISTVLVGFIKKRKKK